MHVGASPRIQPRSELGPTSTEPRDPGPTSIEHNKTWTLKPKIRRVQTGRQHACVLFRPLRTWTAFELHFSVDGQLADMTSCRRPHADTSSCTWTHLLPNGRLATHLLLDGRMLVYLLLHGRILVYLLVHGRLLTHLRLNGHLLTYLLVYGRMLTRVFEDGRMLAQPRVRRSRC